MLQETKFCSECTTREIIPTHYQSGDCRHCWNCKQFAGDLIVHGKTVVEHSQNLHKLLARLEEKKLTLNSDKFTFGMSKVVFMGILLFKHGTGPTEEKVRAVKTLKEAVRPSSISEVRSFMGLVGFSSRFIPDFVTKAEPLRILCRQGEKFAKGSICTCGLPEFELVTDHQAKRRSWFKEIAEKSV